MIWVVGGCLVLGLGLCGMAGIAHLSAAYTVDSAGPVFLLLGMTWVCVGVVLAIANAAVKALL